MVARSAARPRVPACRSSRSPGMPGSMRKHLNPATPAPANGTSVPVEAGQSTPGYPIHTALAGGRCTFRFERGHRRCFRETIQRHIDQCGVTAGGGGASGGGESFPFRSARFVHVHMRIHQAGQQHQIAEGAARLRAARLRDRVRTGCVPRRPRPRLAELPGA